MTPKEKAKELVEKVLVSALPFRMSMERAKQCALITVEEIVQIAHEDPHPRPKTKVDKEYWLEVKEELNKS